MKKNRKNLKKQLKKLSKKARHLFKAAPLLWISFIWYLLSSFADQIISRFMTTGYIESNAYARDIAGNFLPFHALLWDSLLIFEMVVVALIFYFGLRNYKPKAFAQMPGAMLFLYYGSGHWMGFVSNIWVIIHWYIPDAFLRY